MPLIKSTLAQALEDVFGRGPSAPEAAAAWAKAYVSYASGAMSAVSELPTTAMAGLSTLTGVFTSAFSVQTTAGSAAVIAQGVMAYWQTMVWVGPGYAGVTTVPGNFSLASALADVFADLDKKSARDKAGSVADAFDAGAKMVMVLDTLLAPPFTPSTGPIS